MSNQAVILVSGGMDSATAIYEAMKQGYESYFRHTPYGQRTEPKEQQCAEQLAEEVGTEDFLHVKTEHLARISASSLTDEGIEASNADMESDEIPTSYVLFRNANLFSMANDNSAVFIGAHSEDFAGYPDYRPEFFEAFQQFIDVTETRD